MAMIPGCEWVDEPARRLDPARRTDAQHLNHDALVAEEVAIRFADAQRGHRSGHYKGPVEYQHTRERCLSTLSETIAVRHGVGADDVIAAVGRRDAQFDAIYVLLFVLVYGLAANRVALRLAARFPSDERWPALIAGVAAAPFVGAAGAMIGALGASVAEMLRVRDTHLSYRVFRIPWNEHWLSFYLGGVALFGLIAGARLAGRGRGRHPAK